MYGSMANIQSATADIRRGKNKNEEEEGGGKKLQGKNIVVCHIP